MASFGEIWKKLKEKLGIGKKELALEEAKVNITEQEPLVEEKEQKEESKSSHQLFVEQYKKEEPKTYTERLNESLISETKLAAYTLIPLLIGSILESKGLPNEKVKILTDFIDNKMYIDQNLKSYIKSYKKEVFEYNRDGEYYINKVKKYLESNIDFISGATGDRVTFKRINPANLSYNESYGHNGSSIPISNVSYYEYAFLEDGGFQIRDTLDRNEIVAKNQEHIYFSTTRTYNKDGILMEYVANDQMTEEILKEKRNNDLATTSISMIQKNKNGERENVNLEVYNGGHENRLMPKYPSAGYDHPIQNMKFQLELMKISDEYLKPFVVPDNITPEERKAKIDEIMQKSDSTKLKQMYNKEQQLEDSNKEIFE